MSLRLRTVCGEWALGAYPSCANICVVVYKIDIRLINIVDYGEERLD